MDFFQKLIGTVVTWHNYFADDEMYVPDCKGEPGRAVSRPKDMFTNDEVLYSGLDVRMVGARQILDRRIETEKGIDDFLESLL